MNDEKVYNWHLGRQMDYAYPEHRVKRQFAAVFNLNRCIGCQTCTMSCKATWTFSRGQEAMWWNNVETKPFGGYPQNWDVKLLQILEAINPGGQAWHRVAEAAQETPYGVFDGMTIFEAAKRVADDSGRRAVGYLPPDDEWRYPNIYEDTAVLYPTIGKDGITERGSTLPEHKTWFFYLPRICNHCTYPACLAACPRKAIYKRPEDGVVLLDQSRCRGYKRCVEQCPYKKVMFRPTTRVSEKCIACYPRLEGKDPLTDGEPMETRCMTACVGKIRLQGFLDGRPDNPMVYLIREEKVALPLYPQFGLEPNVYYVPPRWVPRDYLHQMFGPGVEHALERYLTPSLKLLGCLQLFRTTQRILASFRVDGSAVEDAVAIGFDEKGDEVIRVPIADQHIERPAERHFNIT